MLAGQPCSRLLHTWKYFFAGFLKSETDGSQHTSILETVISTTPPRSGCWTPSRPPRTHVQTNKLHHYSTRWGRTDSGEDSEPWVRVLAKAYYSSLACVKWSEENLRKQGFALFQMLFRKVAHHAPLSMGFYKQEYWSGLLCPPPGDLPNPGIKPRSPALQTDDLLSEPPGKPIRKVLVIYNLIF